MTTDSALTMPYVVSTCAGGLAQVETTSGRIVKAESVVMATNTPVNDLVAIHLKQAAGIATDRRKLFSTERIDSEVTVLGYARSLSLHPCASVE